MKKILLVVGCECRTRLRRPSFWVLTVLVPVVLAMLYVLPVVAAHKAAEPTTVLVVDETGLFAGALPSTDEVVYRTMPSLDYAWREGGDRDAVLFVPMRETTIPHDAILYYNGSMPSLTVQNTVEHHLQQLLRNAILEDVYHLEPSVYHSVEATRISLHAREAASGRESHLQVKTVAAITLGVLMVLAVILFGVQTVRSVMEERQNRMAELLATSVRPVQLLAGKMCGVALTAVLQLMLWSALTAAAIAGVQASAPDLFAQARAQQEQRALASKGEAATMQYQATVTLVDQTVEGLTAIQLPLVAALFFLFFIAGYLFYGSLLAALAARLDVGADALQWTLLVSAPLLVTLALAVPLLKAPAGALATWLTLVPFTAPVAAMLRLPFGLPIWQVVTATVVLLIAAALAAVAAARMYRRHLVK